MQGKEKVQTQNYLTDTPGKEVVYDNRVLHVRKKFTLPQHLVCSQKKSFNLLQRTKKSGCFSKFVDNIVSNRQLCRRGPFDLPFPLDVPQSKPKRLKTDTGLSQEKALSQRRLKTERSVQKQVSKLSWAKLKEMQEKEKKELPILRSTRYEHQETIPIKVQKFVSKAVTRAYCLSPEQVSRQKQNIMLRKLNVQLINYQLLGKLVSAKALS